MWFETQIWAENQPALPSTLYDKDSASVDSDTVRNAAWKASTAHLMVFNVLQISE